MMTETLLPVRYKNIVFREMNKNNPAGYEEAMNLLIEDRELLAELKNYYKQIFMRDIDSFIEFNQSMKQSSGESQLGKSQKNEQSLTVQTKSQKNECPI
jgi:hypothetical protein